MVAGKHGLFIFNRDLRVQDNLALLAICKQVDSLDCIYVHNPAQASADAYGCQQLGQHSQRFLLQSLHQLDIELQLFGQHLKVLSGPLLSSIDNYLRHHQIDLVVQSAPYGTNEQRLADSLANKLSDLDIAYQQVWQHTLFSQVQLPFNLEALPAHFTPFRQKIEPLFPDVANSHALISMPPPATNASPLAAFLQDTKQHIQDFRGGNQAGIAHLEAYFGTDAPLTYKQTRDQLDSWTSSSKLSPWLAWGCLSVRQVWQQILNYEQQKGANQSTYWLKFELLWREYFHWYLQRHQHKVFRFSGINGRAPLTTFHADYFAMWCAGNTPYPLVNAIMHQLNQTGYISNRARQIAASCWVNELQGDWRYGAAYFQQQLLDYDVAVNWGNWQYIAGVGADPRGGRRFDLEKQTRLYDPDGRYIRRWQGQATCQPLATRDAVGWPMPASGDGISAGSQA
ncbi:DASH family cryptochrome [Bowmanella sp. Y26]|nr:DASH family cryptochrome [Bowmanella yangjiangensis]MBT1064474.1 DASH family cryptochrome [Bowmanella yangjiangensis]